MYDRYMTNEQNEPKLPRGKSGPTVVPPRMDPLIAQILTANAKQAEWVTNQVLDNKDHEIAEWQSRFFKLYEAIDNANLKVDSLRIDQILVQFGWAAECAAQALDSH